MDRFVNRGLRPNRARSKLVDEIETRLRFAVARRGVALFVLAKDINELLYSFKCFGKSVRRHVATL